MVMERMMGEIGAAPGRDVLAEQAVTIRAAAALRPPGALAPLDRLAAWLAAWQRTDTPSVDRPALVLAAGDHGVTSRGVSAYPRQVTTAMVDAIRAGVATSSVMAAHLGVALRVVDAGVGRPTGDIVVEDALSTDRFEHLVGVGRETVATLDTDLLLIGEMGIGNTTAAAAVAHALCGGSAADFVGPGSGIDAEGVARKSEVVRSAVARLGDSAPPLEVLRRVGGSELAVLAGSVAEARIRSVPVLVDGFIATAAIAPLHHALPGALDHCVAAHRSPEPGHGLLLDRLGMEPLLDLGLRLGEGTGALVALPLVALAAAAVVDVATFEEWGLV